MGGKKPYFAKNATVIMVKGLYSDWKQPIAYFFIESQFRAELLISNIQKCVIQLSDWGLYVDALITDMGSNFIKLSNLLKITHSKPYFTVENKKIMYIFDTCHLIKATRNNLIMCLLLKINEHRGYM